MTADFPMLSWIPQPYAILTAFGDTQIKLVNQLLLRHEMQSLQNMHSQSHGV